MLAAQKSHGYSIYKEFQNLGIDVSISLLYKKLKKLEKEGIVKSRPEFKKGKMQKVYFISPKGKKKVEECRKNLKKILSELLNY